MKLKKLSSIIYFLIVILLLVAIAFIGYYYGFLNFIYNVMAPNAFSKYSLVVLSVIFGIAAFFSPCAFTVLPAYVTNYLTKEGRFTKIGKSLYFGFIAALGIITVNLIIGIFIGILGSATPFAKDPRQDIPLILAIRVLAGLLIIIFGIFTLIGRTVNLHFLQRFLAKQSISRNMYFYGIIYNAAAVGCTGPILLGLMLYAYASGSFAFAFTAFAVFSLTMGFLMVLITLLTGIFKQTLAAKLVPLIPSIKMMAAIIMILAGLAIVLLTLEGNNLFVKIFFPYLE